MGIKYMQYLLGDIFKLSAGGDLDRTSYSPFRTNTYCFPIYSNSIDNHGLYGFTSKYNYKGDSITITGRGNVGHAEYRAENFDAIIRLLVLEPNTDLIIDSKFVAEYINQCVQFPLESTGVPQLTVPQIKNIKIKVPEYDEQKKIAEVISDIDKLIVTLEKQIVKKKAVKQGVMQELLSGKRRLEGFEKEWEIKKLQEYCSLITKQTGFDYTAYIKPALLKRKLPNTLPMIQTINFQGRDFSFDTDYYIPKEVGEQFPNIILNSKCVLFSIVGASVGNIGLYPGGESFCGGAIGITRFFDEEDAEWVYYYMCSAGGQEQILFVTKGGAQATVTIADIRNFRIPTPEKEERRKIVAILSDIDSEIKTLEKRLEKYICLKQGMMEQLLTGKMRLI